MSLVSQQPLSMPWQDRKRILPGSAIWVKKITCGNHSALKKYLVKGRLELFESKFQKTNIFAIHEFLTFAWVLIFSHLTFIKQEHIILLPPYIFYYFLNALFWGWFLHLPSEYFSTMKSTMRKERKPLFIKNLLWITLLKFILCAYITEFWLFAKTILSFSFYK